MLFSSLQFKALYFQKVLHIFKIYLSTLVLLNQGLLDMPHFANTVDPDHLASEEANWSGSALFITQQFGSSNLIGWQLEVGVQIHINPCRNELIHYDKG